MRRLALAAAAATCTLAASVAGPALAGPGHQSGGRHPNSPKTFSSSVSPSRGVKSGTTLHDTSSKAKRSTAYYCVFIVIHGANYGADLNSLSVVKSNKRGHISCTKTFKPYSVTDQQGKTRHCPPTRADRRAGFSCALSLADQKTQGQTSASVAKFSAK